MLILKILLVLISLALRGAIYVVIASVILTMVRTYLRPSWSDHPAVRTVIAIGDALCAPARAVLELFAIPTRPFDFSPLLTTVALEILLTLLNVIPR